MNVNSERILILAPSENDSGVAMRVLEESNLTAATCIDVQDLCEKLFEGCGVLVIAEEALTPDQLFKLQAVLNRQEAWSDLPVILLTGRGASRTLESFSESGNISILERPFKRITLVRSVEVGLRARRKQYQVRQLLEVQRQATQMRDEFFASLSHELRTPLNVILGWTEIMRSGELPRESQVEALTILERNAQVQKSLIDDLLDTSRIITGKLHLDSHPVALAKLLADLCRSYAPRLAERRQTLEFKDGGLECAVAGDEARLSQVFSNLLTNAMKFTPNGGHIKLALEKNADQLKVTIKDNGCGIDPNFLPFVFDRLKQEDMSTTRSHGGLGLGLAITSHIVEQHNGKITAKSDGRDRGSEFTVTLPCLDDAVVPALETSPVKAYSMEQLKVLVVDDSPDILTLISLWLNKTHAQIKLTSSAGEALTALPIFRPDVLLSDIGMPEIDGYQLIDKIRHHSDKGVRDVYAIALTAYAKDEERAKAIDAGFQMHISKPISSSQLLAAVSSAAQFVRH